MCYRRAQGPIRTLAEVKSKFTEYAVLEYSGAGLVVEKHSTITDLDVGDRVAYGGEGTGHGETALVGHNLVTKIPEHVPFEYACFTTLGSIALNAVRIANISLGEKDAVIGLGLVVSLSPNSPACRAPSLSRPICGMIASNSLVNSEQTSRWWEDLSYPRRFYR
jgi:hypothetical protein